MFRYFCWFFAILCLFINRNLIFNQVKKIAILTTAICILNGIYYAIFYFSYPFKNLILNYYYWDFPLIIVYFAPTIVFSIIIFIFWIFPERSANIIPFFKKRLTFYNSLLIAYSINLINVIKVYGDATNENFPLTLVFFILNFVGIILIIYTSIRILKQFSALREYVSAPVI